VYRAAKNLPEGGWSNLNIDVIYKNLGVEHKMLCVRSDKSIKEYCGTSLMHPAATRSIRIASLEEEPTQIARNVLSQYADLIRRRRDKVAENTPKASPDMRIGWLLWQESLRPNFRAKFQEFLFWERGNFARKSRDPKLFE
jgi:hypothetical protein